jgi:hypothetical protein
MAEFYRISQDEMEDLLYNELDFPKQHNPLEGINAGELVYGKAFKVGQHPLSLRVYSSITHGQAKDVGSDAIRVALLLRRPDGEIRGIGKAKRVHRVKGWRLNLTKRVKSMVDSINAIVACPKCGMPMAKRNGQHGEFYGCSDFPKCKGTQKIT